jgi:hypothetical protein
MKLKPLLLTILILSSCQSLHSNNPDSIFFDIPDGSTLTLNKSLPIAEGYTHALIQYGKVTTTAQVNNYDVNCRFELKKFGPRTIEPETFKIRDTEDGQEWVSQPSIKRFYTEVFLDSDKGTDVIKLTCQDWGDAIDKNFPVADMQKTLGDYFTFKFLEKTR